MKRKNVIVTDYDPQWKIEFNYFKKRFTELLGDLAISIEHVGSTSVEGLAAKPVIDIDVIIDLDDFQQVKSKFETLGYFHNGDQGIPGREAFKLPPELKSKFYEHHLYVCDKDTLELHMHIAFRDYLRTYDEIRDEYGEIKKEAAKLHPHDIDGYMTHKGEFIVLNKAKALKWAGKEPRLTIVECVKCGNEDLVSEFFLKSLGEGFKRMYFEVTCRSCGNKWNVNYEVEKNDL